MANVVKGTVWADAGKTTPVDGRTVRVYRADTGVLLGSSVSGGSGGDARYNDASFILDFEGAEGSSTILDTGPSARTVTQAGGSNVVISTSPSIVNGGSGSFDTNRWLSVPCASFNIRTSPFAMFGWLRRDASRTDWCLMSNPSNFYLEVAGGTLYLGDGSINPISTSIGAAVPSGSDVHVALTFDGTTYRVFFGGVLFASTTTLLKSVALTSMLIGYRNSGNYTKGLWDAVTLVTGHAVWTSNFTPPPILIEPYDLDDGEYLINTGAYSGEVIVLLEGEDDPLTNHKVLRTETVVE